MGIGMDVAVKVTPAGSTTARKLSRTVSTEDKWSPSNSSGLFVKEM
jgi:hypothetical protein